MYIYIYIYVYMDAMRGLGEMKVLIQLPLTSHHFTRGLRVSGT